MRRIEYNNEVLEFPDNMTDSQIESVIKQQYEQPQNDSQVESTKKRDIGAVEAGITGFGQGASLGFGDEIIAALATPVVYGGSRLAEAAGFDTKGLADKTLAETYRGEQQKNQQGIEEAAEAQPAAFLGGELAGSVVGAGKLAPKGLGQAMRTGGLPARMAKGAALGAGTSAVYGAGVADPDKISQGATEGGIQGAALGAAIPVAGNLLKSKPAQSTAKQIRQAASQAYKKAAEEGGVLKSKVINKFINDASSLAPQTQEGKILAGDDSFTKLINNVKLLENKNISLQGAQEIDEILGNKIDSFFDPKTGRISKEGLKVQQVQQAFRKSVENAGIKDIVGSKAGFDSLKEGRKLWSQAARLDDIERIIARAEQADSPATALRTGFRTLSNNPSRLRGFSKEERSAIKKAAKTGIVTDTLRVMGSRLLPIGAMATGGGVGGAAAAQLGSISARGLAGKAQAKKAEKVLQTIYGQGQKQLPRYPLSPALAAPITQTSTENGN